MDCRRGFDYTERLDPRLKEGAMMRLTPRGGGVVFVLFWGVVMPLILFGWPR